MKTPDFPVQRGQPWPKMSVPKKCSNYSCIQVIALQVITAYMYLAYHDKSLAQKSAHVSDLRFNSKSSRRNKSPE